LPISAAFTPATTAKARHVGQTFSMPGINSGSRHEEQI
jgi:hypothetical protein